MDLIIGFQHGSSLTQSFHNNAFLITDHEIMFLKHDATLYRPSIFTIFYHMEQIAVIYLYLCTISQYR